MRTAPPKLLVSVRSVEEAQAALDGGADLIDVKEPSRGPLGMANRAIIDAIVKIVNCRVPVSAAMGEWADHPRPEFPLGVKFVKFGLAGIGEAGLLEWQQSSGQYGGRNVLVAYADHERARSPEPGRLVEMACTLKCPAFLIDTAIKDGTTLLDWVERFQLDRWRTDLSEAGVALALAGSLNEHLVRTLAPLRPEWFAVRGAACVGGREGTIRSDKIRQLKEVITDSFED